MEYSRGDLWDRWTIEWRKLNYGADNAATVIALEKALDEGIDLTTVEARAVAMLAMANDSIAVLEWQIRADHKLSDEEVGLRAREIRKINGKRVWAKNFLDGKSLEFVPAFDIDFAKLNLAIPDAAK